ncbi:hypothetical protein, partial [Thiolapillus sp.]|uniref:hypothetical protein n=1 Tax=Thiolapillus sp. TaxID=2017437 RepID=UPI003AF5404A
RNLTGFRGLSRRRSRVYRRGQQRIAGARINPITILKLRPGGGGHQKIARALINPITIFKLPHAGGLL